MGLLFPIYGKIKKMFQTTNQLLMFGSSTSLSDPCHCCQWITHSAWRIQIVVNTPGDHMSSIRGLSMAIPCRNRWTDYGDPILTKLTFLDPPSASKYSRNLCPSFFTRSPPHALRGSVWESAGCSKRRPMDHLEKLIIWWVPRWRQPNHKNMSDIPRNTR